MCAVLAIITAAVTGYILIYYNVFRGTRCRSTAMLNGKTAVVTGETCNNTVHCATIYCNGAERVFCILSALSVSYSAPSDGIS